MINCVICFSGCLEDFILGHFHLISIAVFKLDRFNDVVAFSFCFQDTSYFSSYRPRSL